MACVDLPDTVDLCVGEIVCMAIDVGGDTTLAEELGEAVAVFWVIIEIVAFVSMSAIVNVGKGNERFVTKYKDEGFFVFVQVVFNPIIEGVGNVTICSCVRFAVVVFVDNYHM